MRFSMGTGLLASLILIPASARAITFGQIETFESGKAMWVSSASTSLLDDGGPAGVGDAYLRITRPDTRPGSLGVFQRHWDVWGGDYLAAGVNAIEADFINLGMSDLAIRFQFSTQTPPTTVFTSSAPFVLPPDAQWHHVRFGLSPGDMTPDPSLALRDVGPVGFLHLADLAELIVGRTPVIGSLGIDNIRATPEPVSLVLLMVGVGVVFAQGRPMQRMG